MHELPNGVVPIVNLPGSGSLLWRSWKAYSQLFPQLVHLMILFALGALVNLLIASLFLYIGKDTAYALKVFLQVILMLFNIATALYYSYIFAAMLYVIHGWASGRPLTVGSSLELAKDRFASLFWVGLLLSLTLSGGALLTALYPLAAVIPFVFSIWYYFAIYVTLFDQEKGIVALSKSRDLVHGIFWKVVGRYITITALFAFLFLLAYLTLLIQSIGWIIFLMLAACLAFFLFPFFAAYEYFRYEDLVHLKRGVEFIDFKGERVAIGTWIVAGLLLFTLTWTASLLSPGALKSITDSFTIQKRITVLGTMFSRMNENLNTLSEYLQKFQLVQPQPQIQPGSQEETLIPQDEQINLDELLKKYPELQQNQ